LPSLQAGGEAQHLAIAPAAGVVASHSWSMPCPIALSFSLEEKLELGININLTQKQPPCECLFPGQCARIQEWIKCLCCALLLLHARA